MVAIGDLMFFKSHTLTVRSSLPETTLSPTVNTADVTVLRAHRHTQTQTHTPLIDQLVRVKRTDANTLIVADPHTETCCHR